MVAWNRADPSCCCWPGWWSSSAAVIVATSGESIAVRYLTMLVALDIATRLVLSTRRRSSDR